MSQSPNSTATMCAREPHRSLLSVFPMLKELADPDWLDAIGRAKLVEMPAETRVFSEGEPCSQYAFVLGGSVRDGPFLVGSILGGPILGGPFLGSTG